MTKQLHWAKVVKVDYNALQLGRMKLSTKTRYGTRALLDLGMHYGRDPVLLKDIARRQEISLPYLEHIISPLISAGILRTSRGSKGGVSLARPPRDIRLSEIIDILDGPVTIVECLTDLKACPRQDDCTTKDVWRDLRAAINDKLRGFTLHDLVERQRRKMGPPAACTTSSAFRVVTRHMPLPHTNYAELERS